MKKTIKNKDTPVILLTATINPNGMGYTALQDSDIRTKQYLEAIDFYLNNTNLKIVFCENSGCNIFNNIKSIQKFKRLEYLTFLGNNYDKNKGKSYGEGLIIKYALENSLYLKESDYIIKITGRVKILNLLDMIKMISESKNLKNIIIGEFAPLEWFKTVCFFSSKIWILSTIYKYGYRLNDTGLNFEKMVFKSISENKRIKSIRFHPKIEGICGGENKPYKNLSYKERKTDHYYALTLIYKAQNRYFYYYLYYLKWVYNILEMKFLIKNKLSKQYNL